MVNIAVPQLEVVGQQRSVSMSAHDAPSVIAMKRVGHVFQEFDSDSSVMVVLEGDQPLGDEAHEFYDEIVEKLLADTTHVEHIQDFWSDPLTAAGSQSNDGKAAYVQVYLAGNQGETLANESVEAAQHIVAGVTAPPGVKAYVTGPAALATDLHIAGDRSLKMITMITFGVIIADAAAHLPVHRHDAPRHRHGDDRTGRGARRGRSAGAHGIIGLYHLRDEPADDGGDRGIDRLRDLPVRPLSGSP